MVHRSMRNGSRVADELYIKRVLMALEDFLFFSVYSFSCIAKEVTTLKQLRLLSCLVLFSIPHYCHQYHLRPTLLVTPAVILVLHTLSLRFSMRARWQLKACSRACMSACLSACLKACLREPRFGRSRVLLHWKPLADGKL